MSDSGPAPIDPGVLTKHPPAWSRIAAYALGVALASAAIWAVVRGGAGTAAALDSLAAARTDQVALLLALSVMSVGMTAVTFWILTCRHGRVGGLEMLALINAGWLLNYLPLWPGMFGRFAYHRAVNGIAVRDTAVATIWANVLALVAALGLLVVLMILAAVLAGDDWRLAGAAALPVALLSALAAYTHARPPKPDPQFWRIPAALAVRWLELHVWAARYSLCFALIGAPIGWGAALALAGVTGVSSLVPITGNSLGLREWVVGLAAPLLPLGLTLQSKIGLQTGLTADLLNRAVELILAVPCGVIAAMWIGRRLRRIPSTDESR